MSAQPTTAPVETTTLADGVLVHLGGRLDAATVPSLREALLAPRLAGRDDVLVDAGAVQAVDDAALAVLLAAPRWAEVTGGRLAYTRVSPALRRAARALELDDLLPELAAPGCRA